MSATTATGRAIGVSKTLRAADLRPLPSGTPRGREGIRVSRNFNGGTSVSVVIYTAGHRRRLTEAVVEALKAAGYTIASRDDTDIANYLHVTKEG